jgi:hypothetical protein
MSNTAERCSKKLHNGKNATDRHTAGEVPEVGSLQEALRAQQK